MSYEVAAYAALRYGYRLRYIKKRPRHTSTGSATFGRGDIKERPPEGRSPIQPQFQLKIDWMLRLRLSMTTLVTRN